MKRYHVSPLEPPALDGIPVRQSRREFLRIGLALATGVLAIESEAPIRAGNLPAARLATPRPGAESRAAMPGGSGEAGSLGERVGNEAEQIVRTLRHTHYQHQQHIDVATGTYDVDCSGFVSFVLQQVAPEHLHLIPKESGWEIPRAFKYEEFFSSLSSRAEHGWRAIADLSQVRRGDIVAWSLPSHLGKEEDTGHVFVVAATPTEPEAGLLAVRACDSSTVRHHHDSRAQNDGAFHTGVGIGTIHFKVDGAGKPLSFQFGPSDRFHRVPIAIGRATEAGGHGRTTALYEPDAHRKPVRITSSHISGQARSRMFASLPLDGG